MIYSFFDIQQLALPDFCISYFNARSPQFLLWFFYLSLSAVVASKCLQQMEFWSCTWQLCIRWMALDYVTDDEGHNLAKSLRTKSIFVCEATCSAVLHQKSFAIASSFLVSESVTQETVLSHKQSTIQQWGCFSVFFFVIIFLPQNG